MFEPKTTKIEKLKKAISNISLQKKSFSKAIANSLDNVVYKYYTFEKIDTFNFSTIRKIVFYLLNSIYFEIFIFILWLINISVLAIDHALISDYVFYKIEIIDVVITFIFTIEILLRFISYGVKNYLNNRLYILDLLIIISNLCLLIYQYINYGNIISDYYSNASIIKCFKFLRILRFIIGLIFWKRGAILFMETLNASINNFNFIILIIIYNITASFLGVQLFSDYQIHEK